MAMRNVFRLVGVAAACAVLALALLPPSRREPPKDWIYPTTDLSEKRYRLHALLYRSVRAWRAASRRDSVSKIVELVPRDTQSRPPILMDDALTQDIRDLSNGTIEQAWMKLGIASPAGATAVVLLRDSVRNIDDYDVAQSNSEGMEFIIPAAGDTTGTCVSVLMLRNIHNNRVATRRFLSGLRFPRSTLFGPCAFYAAFGAPGARIASWLEGRRYDFAMRSNWTEAPGAKLRMRFRPGTGATLLMIMGGDSDLDNMSLTQRACWLGRAASCEAVVLAPIPDSMFTGRVRGVYPPEIVYDAASSYAREAWDDAYREFLADMRNDIGAEKFARFWKSGDEPAVAFRNATGQSLGEWTHKWVVDLYGPTVAGAKMPASYFGLGLLFAVGCVSVAAAVAARRNVG